MYVFVCCCPKNVLVLIQRPNIEQYTHAFSIRLWCACAHISHAGWFVGKMLKIESDILPVNICGTKFGEDVHTL